MALRPWLWAIWLWAITATAAAAAEPAGQWQARVAEHAAHFAARVPGLVTVETLTQRAYNIPPHSRVAIGGAAKTLYAQYLARDLVSEYTIGPLSNGVLVERREWLSLDGKPLQAEQAARRALLRAPAGDVLAARRATLERLNRLGLVDVATEFALLLLLFTPDSHAGLEWTAAGTALVGTEDAIVFQWRQTAGGALDFQKGKTKVRPLQGSIWIREADGLPLRVTTFFEHEDRQPVRDEASIEFELLPALGCPTPVSVVHRHYVAGQLLTENLYLYDKFRPRDQGR